MQLPELTTVTQGKSLLRLRLGELSVYFSYRQPVAFRACGELVVCNSKTGRSTTAFHLDQIDGGSEEARRARVDERTFEKKWEEAVGHYLGKPTVTA